MSIDELVEKLALLPHPEGGYYRETYRSPGLIDAKALPAEFTGNRHYSTGIYFLLTTGNFSAFHKVIQDEMWHFYLGAPIELFEIDPSGHLQRTIVGNDLSQGQQPQYLVPGGNWFASRVLPGSGEYSLAGCTVAPGFDFKDFTLVDRAQLMSDFPLHKEIIAELTR